MRRLLVPGVAATAVVFVVALALFQPWRLFTSSTVDESELSAVPESAAPTPSDPPTPSSTPAEEPSPSPTPTPKPEPKPEPKPNDLELARGTFEDAEHGTSGEAVVRKLADGRRVLRLVGLDTSDGPDLHVWITDQPSGGDWGSYDDGRYVRLGALKANRGNQNYAIPTDAELGGLTSVVIWCDRFNVAFGTAAVEL